MSDATWSATVAAFLYISPSRVGFEKNWGAMESNPELGCGI